MHLLTLVLWPLRPARSVDAFAKRGSQSSPLTYAVYSQSKGNFAGVRRAAPANHYGTGAENKFCKFAKSRRSRLPDISTSKASRHGGAGGFPDMQVTNAA